MVRCAYRAKLRIAVNVACSDATIIAAILDFDFPVLKPSH